MRASNDAFQTWQLTHLSRSVYAASYSRQRLSALRHWYCTENRGTGYNRVSACDRKCSGWIQALSSSTFWGSGDTRRSYLGAEGKIQVTSGQWPMQSVHQLQNAAVPKKRVLLDVTVTAPNGHSEDFPNLAHVRLNEAFTKPDGMRRSQSSAVENLNLLASVCESNVPLHVAAKC